jgi:hypothetical protein
MESVKGGFIYLRRPRQMSQADFINDEFAGYKRSGKQGSSSSMSLHEAQCVLAKGKRQNTSGRLIHRIERFYSVWKRQKSRILIP